MAQFYGWSPEYIEQMEYAKALEYFEAITVIEAQKMLADMQVAQYPKLQKESAKKLHRDVKKQAYPNSLRKKMSFDQLFEAIKNG